VRSASAARLPRASPRPIYRRPAPRRFPRSPLHLPPTRTPRPDGVSILAISVSLLRAGQRPSRQAGINPAVQTAVLPCAQTQGDAGRRPGTRPHIRNGTQALRHAGTGPSTEPAVQTPGASCVQGRGDAGRRPCTRRRGKAPRNAGVHRGIPASDRGDRLPAAHPERHASATTRRRRSVHGASLSRKFKLRDI
jgi:hypothetical protein